MNLTNTIIPRSDMLNADDLIAGPRTVKITDVQPGTAEMPVHVHYDGENGRPYKPGKSMRRVLVAMWGSDSKAYIGQRITLYNDPTIKFGGAAVGGIRISHATGISETLHLALTETRGKRKPHKVEVMPPEAVPETEKLATQDQLTDLKSFYANQALTESIEKALAFYKLTAAEMDNLTAKQADVIITKCRKASV